MKFLAALLLGGLMFESLAYEYEGKQYTLTQRIGQMLMVGFEGTSACDTGVKVLSKQIQKGKVGSVILFKRNIQGQNQLLALNNFLSKAAKDGQGAPLGIAVDQEGEPVQRLDATNGFLGFPSAAHLAQYEPGNFDKTKFFTNTISEGHSRGEPWELTMREKSWELTKKDYDLLAHELDIFGFTWDFAPVVDLNSLGGWIRQQGRSYGYSPETVIKYAELFMDNLHGHQVLNCIKHFPGHGSAGAPGSKGGGDSHKGLVDVTLPWSPQELEPFQKLIKTGKVDSVMMAHLLIQENKVAGDGSSEVVLTSVSKPLIDKLRKDYEFQGVVVADDGHMGAILEHFGYQSDAAEAFKKEVAALIKAGNDMLIFSNNPSACPNISNFVPDALLPDYFVQVVEELVRGGEVSEESINTSFERIMRMKNKFREESK